MKKVLLSASFLMFSCTVSMAQCAMCQASVASNLSEGRGVIGTGLNFGILYLLSTPYLLVAGLFFAWYRASRKEQDKKMNITQD